MKPLLTIQACLIELLRLYDLRFELAKLEAAARTKEERDNMCTLLNVYGHEKKHAWRRARELLVENATPVERPQSAEATGADLAVQELRNIFNAERFNRERFRDDTEFANWARSRCQFTLSKVEKMSQQQRRAGTGTVDMLLFCPRCHKQHIDAPSGDWMNPPHATHTCAWCRLLWRPSNANTNGVARIEVLEEKHDARIAASWPTDTGECWSCVNGFCVAGLYCVAASNPAP